MTAGRTKRVAVTIVEDGDEPLVRLEPYIGTWSDDDTDVNFRVDVATYSQADPLATLRVLGANLGIPVGALIRYVLATWVSDGAAALLEIGPTAVQRLVDAVDHAEAVGTDEARLAAYRQLQTQLTWLAHGLDEPASTYPAGGADPSGA